MYSFSFAHPTTVVLAGPTHCGRTHFRIKPIRDNLAFNLSRQGKPDAKLLVAKFETADSAAQVRDYYKSKLGGKVTKFTEDSSDGSMSFEMKADNQHGRYVQIKPAEGKTEIDLVRIEGMDLSDSSK